MRDCQALHFSSHATSDEAPRSEPSVPNQDKISLEGQKILNTRYYRSPKIYAATDAFCALCSVVRPPKSSLLSLLVVYLRRSGKTGVKCPSGAILKCSRRPMGYITKTAALFRGFQPAESATNQGPVDATGEASHMVRLCNYATGQQAPHHRFSTACRYHGSSSHPSKQFPPFLSYYYSPYNTHIKKVRLTLSKSTSLRGRTGQPI